MKVIKNMAESILNQTEIVKYLDKDSELPPNIEFKIYDRREEKVVGQLNAHKMVLGMVSPVFRCGFFKMKNHDMVTEEIVIRDTSLPAFKAMIDMIYKKETVATILNGLDRCEMFETLNLSERYDIPSMKKDITKHLLRLPLKKNNVVETAALAKDYSQLGGLQSTCKDVFTNCSIYLEREVRTIHELLVFCKEHAESDNVDVALQLMSQMSDITERKKREGEEMLAYATSRMKKY